MCGIFGLSGIARIKYDRLKEVSKILSHRGPDDEGILMFNSENSFHKEFRGEDTIPEIEFHPLSEHENYNSCFIHRRLSIIDISSSGHQPISYDSGKLWIIYNGEIYNYPEIRAELLKKGYKFASQSDTEVVLASYQEWGTNCVHHFIGMWAFAIWDSYKKTIFLSRDRLGVKPLYYFNDSGSFIFCSEIKGIRSYLDNKLTIKETKIFEFLIRGQIFVGETQETVFSEIKQLMPGCNLLFKQNSIIIEKYWNLKLINNKMSFTENVEHFTELFLLSIRDRLRSDVEVGSCLSGGIDSSSIVSFASSKFGRKLHTFSAIWPGEKCDESAYVEKVNKLCGCNSHMFTPDLTNILEVIDKEIWHQELPLAGSSLLAQWYVIQNSKENNIKVLLDGQGADEVLGGYPFYIPAYVNEMVFYLKWHELFKYYHSLKQNNYNLKWFLNNQKFHFISIIRRPRLPIKKHLFEKNKLNLKHHNGYSIKKLNKFLKYQIELTVLPILLHYADRNSMAHSVESRMPFLDNRLVEFTVNIPAEQKINGAMTKIILRDAMKDYLPEEVYHRTDKIGFSTPIEKNLFNQGSELFEYCLNSVFDSDIYKAGWLENKEINPKNIFSLYSLSRFLNIWN